MNFIFRDPADTDIKTIEDKAVQNIDMLLKYGQPYVGTIRNEIFEYAALESPKKAIQHGHTYLLNVIRIDVWMEVLRKAPFMYKKYRHVFEDIGIDESIL